MTAQNDEGPAGGPTLPEQQRTTDTEHFDTTAADPQAAELAQVERLRAILRQRGIDLLANGADRYTVRRGRLSRVLNGVDAVARLARLIGGAV